MTNYSQSRSQFGYLIVTDKTEQGRIKTMLFRHLGKYPVHTSLAENIDLVGSVEYALEHALPVMVMIESGMVISFSIAQVAVTNKIDDEDDTYVIRHRGDAEDGVFYVSKDSPDCNQVMTLLRNSLNKQIPFCFESKFSVFDMATGPFGRLEYTAIVFLGDD
ncbi:hypothetical protein N9089_05170 [Crocinitomicaceae bacterium]|nr:hypothetical protein [Crocinitomicaceae bacterium]